MNMQKRLIMLFIVLLVLFTIVAYATKIQQIYFMPLEEGREFKDMISLLEKARTPENIGELSEAFNSYSNAVKEEYNLREKSESFLYYVPYTPNSANVDDTGKKAVNKNSGTKGVLLIHGLGASPNEMRALGQFLYENDYTVLGVRLAGHGEGVDALEKTDWEEWYYSVEFAYRILYYMVDEIHVVGISTGSTLGLKLASEHDFESLVTIAPAIKMKDWKLKFISILKYFVRYSDRTLEGEDKITYDEKLPTESVYQLMNMIDDVKTDLKDVDEPLLIIQATDDPRLKKSNPQYVYDYTATPEDLKEMKWIESNEHVILKGDIKDEVFGEVLEFIEE
ncbi:MAG: alpha/beta fold hydrolase [Candidatus Woesearchaeota archaeon]